MKTALLFLALALVRAGSSNCSPTAVAVKSEFMAGDQQFLTLEFSGEAGDAVIPYCLAVDSYSTLSSSALSGESALFVSGDAIDSTATVTPRLYTGMAFSGTTATDDGTQYTGDAVAFGSALDLVRHRTLIVDMDGGAVTGIHWDDRLGCEGACGAGDSTCVADTCAVALDSLADASFEVFVAWNGTDANGDELTSEKKTDYNFRFYSANALYESVTDFFS